MTHIRSAAEEIERLEMVKKLRDATNTFNFYVREMTEKGYIIDIEERAVSIHKDSNRTYTQLETRVLQEIR